MTHCRPATGPDMSLEMFNQIEDTSCPSPCVPPAYREMTPSPTDMRFTRPTPFQESKNFWRKRDSAASQLRANSALSSSRRRSQMILCTDDRLSFDSTPPTDSAHTIADDVASMVVASAVASVPTTRQAHHQYSTPILRNSNFVFRRKKHFSKAAGSLDLRISPRRVTLPKRIRSYGKLPFIFSNDVTSDLDVNPSGVGQNEILVQMEVEIHDELALPGDHPAQERSRSALSMWNDPDEQQQFTTTWREHQEGFTSRDDYLGRLPFEVTTDRTAKDLHQRESPILRAPCSSPPQNLGAPTPPDRKSSKARPMRKPKPLQVKTERTNDRDQIMVEEQVMVQSSSRTRECQRSNSARLSSTPISPVKLRNNKSAESLTQIEAMIPTVSSGTSGMAINQIITPRKSPGQSRRPSRGTDPPGHPPERPLPDLPADHEDGMRQPQSIIVATASETPNHHKVDGSAGLSPYTPTTIDDDIPGRLRPHVMTLRSKSSLRLSDAPVRSPQTNPSRQVSASPSTPTHDLFYSQQPHTPQSCPKPKAKTIVRDRGEKIRELKKKHVAAMAMARAAAGDTLMEVEEVHNELVETMSPVSEFRHPPPPPPLSPPVRRHHASNKSKQETVDELDRFPAVPLSRPGSRASQAPSAPNVRGVARTNSYRRSRSRPRNAQGHQSAVRPDIQQSGISDLSFSVIYVMFDAGPPEAAFADKTACSHSQDCTSNVVHPRQHICVTPVINEPNTLTMTSNSIKASSVKRKQSSRSIRSQASATRSLARHGLERVSPATFSRPGSRHRAGLFSSGDESDRGGAFVKRTASVRPTSKASSRSRASRRHRQSGMPELPISGHFALEHVLMALAKCQNQGVDISHLCPDDVQKLAVQQKFEDELDSRAAKRLSLVQRQRQPTSGSRLDEQRKMLEVKTKLTRPKSDMSIMTMTGTDTDASASTLPSDECSSPGKRGSGGSLTDPTDYDIHLMKPVTPTFQPDRNTNKIGLRRPRRRPSSPTLASKPFAYHQARSHYSGFHDMRPPMRGSSRLHLPPPVAPPRTSSRARAHSSDCLSSAVSTTSKKTTSEAMVVGLDSILDYDGTSTSDPFILDMLDSMATWTNPIPIVDDVGDWYTWADADADVAAERVRVIEGKALFTPPPTANHHDWSVCV